MGLLDALEPTNTTPVLPPPPPPPPHRYERRLYPFSAKNRLGTQVFRELDKSWTGESLNHCGPGRRERKYFFYMYTYLLSFPKTEAFQR